MTTDAELIRRTLNGDHVAFAELVDRHTDAVYALVSEVVRHRDEAEDIVQECFVRAYKSLATFRHDAQFGTWIRRIAYNIAVTRSRQQARRAETFSPEEPASLDMREGGDPLPDSIVEARDLEVRVAKHINNLPEHYRVVLVLFYHEGLSYQDIAEVLDKPANTIKVHMKRAKAWLKKLLLEEAEPVEWISDGT